MLLMKHPVTKLLPVLQGIEIYFTLAKKRALMPPPLSTHTFAQKHKVCMRNNYLALEPDRNASVRPNNRSH